MLTFRQDSVELTGILLTVESPYVPPPTNPPSLPVNQRQWTMEVRPDPTRPDPMWYTHLVNAAGQPNPTGTLRCTVSVDESVIPKKELAALLDIARGERVRLVGTWCDYTDEETGQTTAVIWPLNLLIIDYETAVYDLGGWPVAVKDYGLIAFCYAPDPTSTTIAPHTDESQFLVQNLRFPFVPSDGAIPFWRAYQSTRVDHAASVVPVPAKDTAGNDLLTVTMATGVPSEGKGFFAVEIGMTYDEPKLSEYCPPNHCDETDYCAYSGEHRLMLAPAWVKNAQKGDLVLSPGEGTGIIGGILGSLTPKQGYDHMGIFVDDGFTIRHCTSSQDRLELEELNSYELRVYNPIGDDTVHRIPLMGIRPDLLRYGWPGSITQTVREVYLTGCNTLNPRWSYVAQHPSHDTEDPEQPGIPFKLYQLPRHERQRRLQFNDPEVDRGESMTRLQTPPAGGHVPKLVRPHPQFDQAVRPALHHIADSSLTIDAHYRLYAYSRGDIGADPAFVAPPKTDSSWLGLPFGSNWAAGTVPAVCSTFIWETIRLANATRPPSMERIILEDEVGPEDPDTGLEYGRNNGMYVYQKDERKKAAEHLVDFLKKKVEKKFDDSIPDIAYDVMPELVIARDTTAMSVSNQTTNAFAADACDRIDSDVWQATGGGESVSPDDILHFWDLKPQRGALVQPQKGQCVYGDSEDLIVTIPEWTLMPLFKKQPTNPGTGRVFVRATQEGRALAGVLVRFDGSCNVLHTTAGHEDFIDLTAGIHFADAYMEELDPATGQREIFQTSKPLEFAVVQGRSVSIELVLDPPPDLFRIIDVHFLAEVTDKRVVGDDAFGRFDHSNDWSFRLQKDLSGDPRLADLNDILVWEQTWTTSSVGSGVYVRLDIVGRLDPADRSVACHCEIALIDADNGLDASYVIDQKQVFDVVILPDDTVTLLTKEYFTSREPVPEYANIWLSLTNRRRPG